MRLLFIFTILLFAYGDDLAQQNPLDNPTLPLGSDIVEPNPKNPRDNLDLSTLKQVFPNDYIEDAITGFIDGLEKTILRIDIRRIAIDFSNVSINVSDEYRDYSVNQLSGDNTTIANLVADLALEHNLANGRITNTLYAEYGLTIINPKYDSITRSETADNFLLSSGYTRKVFSFENGFLGPFMNGEYQTEFTKQENGSKNQYLRYKAGIKFLDGKYIDEFYFAGVGEIDFTYKPSSIKGAIEAGIRAKSPITDDIKLVYQGFMRQYVGYSRFRESDLLYNFNVNVRLDVSISNGFAFSPFVSARFGRIRGASRIGSNLTTGISLLFSSSINAISSIESTQDSNLSEYFKSIQ